MSNAPAGDLTSVDDRSRVGSDLRALGLDADDSSRRRAEYSYDASNYRLSPLCVVFPHDDLEVATAVAHCHAAGIPVIARGGGTGMGGNAIGEGVVIDLSRHMTRVVTVDAEHRTALAQAGVVLTELQKAVRTDTDGALTFAPDPSSQSRATLGGAIGNAAGSVGSSVTGGLSSAGGYLGSFVGGGNKEGEKK